MDASNILKPALARGELRLVGATTLNEYRKYIEQDGALARRFQSVFVDEPSVPETISILRGLKSKYEIHHGVKILDSAVVACAVYASRYLTERKMPDKAVDLLDESASRLRMRQESKPDDLSRLDREILMMKIELEALKKENDTASVVRRTKLEAELSQKEEESRQKTAAFQADRERRKEINQYKEKLDRLRHELDEATRQGKWDRAGQIKYQEIPELEQKIRGDGSLDMPDAVTPQEVAQVISYSSGIPVAKLLKGEKERLLDMESQLEARVIGQRHAISKISDAVRIARAGLHSHKKPIGCFLFLGPTGVGKTELAKALADFLFDDENAMTRIDMSEYAERHTVSRLIGAPPGYVGYDEAGLLTESVRRRPYQVVLLDEAEKAHREVHNLLLQVFDEGHLTDSHGRKVDFRNTILVMTSNLGADQLTPAEDLSMLSTEELAERNQENLDRVLPSVRQFFPPEFVNRLDDIVLFNALGTKHMLPIVSIQLNQLQKLLMEEKMAKLDVHMTARAWLASIGYQPEYGARPLKRAIQRYLMTPLSKKIISGEVLDGATIIVEKKPESDELHFSIINPPPEVQHEIAANAALSPAVEPTGVSTGGSKLIDKLQGDDI
eukprot:TRINITY_DN1769_c0_g1_i12.p1 TRINITY_DN1769_c0_g1~~TRINITY_DN1769_c0_g1_i12.p1  ORF type:complete len:677 (-),score=162.11 TRINITY_DN1769_c0_g1_i12:85-1926(-)